MKTPTKCPPKTAHQTPPPKGMWFEERAGQPLPFLARWRLPGGGKDGQAFETESARAAFASAWEKKRRDYGRAAIHVAPRDAEALAEFRKLTGGADLLTVAREWLASRGVSNGAIQLSEAVKKYREAMAERRASPDSVAQRDLHLFRLLSAFPGKTLADLSAEALCGWLRDLAPPRVGGLAAPRTKRAHRGAVARLLDYAVGSGWLTRSPMSAVPVPTVAADEVTLLTPDEARRLFAAARGTRCVGRLALEAFAGLRFSSAQRIALAEINFAEGGITLPGAKHKTGKRHYVKGFPENLWAWLRLAPAGCWSLPPRLYALDKRSVFEAAGLKGDGKDAEALRNCLRHSFATYHLGANKDAALTAYLLTHSRPAMLYQHYAGRAQGNDSEAYFSILP
jgi:integrase